MKLRVNFGEQLKHAKIEYPKLLPLHINGDVIGEAIIQSDGLAEVKVFNEEVKSYLKSEFELGFGGLITSREGSLITGFKMTDFSLILK